jgi:hypothetical protein
VSFEPHSSDYWGDPYYLARDAELGEIRLTENHDPLHDPSSEPPDESFFLPTHREFQMILWLEATPSDAGELAARVAAQTGCVCEVVADG